MRDCCTFEVAILRVVPCVERQEFLNVGVLLSCPSHDFLDAQIELDRTRLRAFAPTIDLDLIEEHLQTIPLICAGGEAAGPIGKLAQRARFYWLTAPRSTMIQCSEVHSGLCENPAATLQKIFQKVVKAPQLAEESC
jgi:hypothetical protein